MPRRAPYTGILLSVLLHGVLLLGLLWLQPARPHARPIPAPATIAVALLPMAAAETPSPPVPSPPPQASTMPPPPRPAPVRASAARPRATPPPSAAPSQTTQPQTAPTRTTEASSPMDTAPSQAAPDQASAAPSSARSRPTERSDALPITPPRFDAAYLANPAPAYPGLSRRLEESGRVLLRVRVGADGKPTAVDIAQSSGHSRLDEAARDAVLRWSFVPARQGEQAMAATVQVPIVFKLQ